MVIDCDNKCRRFSAKIYQQQQQKSADMDTRQEYSRCLDHHHHNLHATNRLLRTANATALHATAAGVVFTAPTSTSSSVSSSFLHEGTTTTTAAHHAQSAGVTTNGGLLRTGLSELSRPGPPHATQAGSVSVSTPSPIPQCQDRYFSSLSINTGSTYGFLHGDRGMTGAIPSSVSASLPFRTPPGLSPASVRHHWSHTPPSPLDSYGRYGIGPNLYSLFPMVTSAADASSYCMQSAAARLFHKANPYHQFLDATRELGLYHHHLHHGGGLPLGSPYSPTLTLDPSDLSTSSSSADIDREGTPMDFMCKNFTGYRDCRSSFVGKQHLSPNMGGGGLSNNSGTGAEFLTHDANGCGVGNVNVGKTSASVRGSRGSEGRRSKSSKESALQDERARTLSTSPGRCSSHPRSSAVKTAFSPPTATAATFAPSKNISSEVATIFKGDTAPPSTSAVEHIQRSANVQKVFMEEQRHSKSASNNDPVKEEFHYKSESCRKREKCNSGNGLRYCTESVSTVVAARQLSEDTIADHFVQVQALNLSQNSGSESTLSVGTAKDEYHIVKERNTCARANMSEKDINGRMSNDQTKDLPLSLKYSEVPTDKVVVCDKSGVKIKQEGKKEGFSECQFRKDSSVIVTAVTTPCTSKMDSSWSTSLSKGLSVTGGGCGHVKEPRKPQLSAHGKESKKYNSTKSLEAIVSSIVSSKSNMNATSTDTIPVATTHVVAMSTMSSCCDTAAKVTTSLASKDSLSKSDQSELQANGDALHLLRACRDAEASGPNKGVSSHPIASNSFSTVRSPHRPRKENDAEKGLDLTKDVMSLTSPRSVHSKHVDSDVKPENLSLDKSVKSVIMKSSKDCILANSGPTMSPFHRQPGPHQWPWHGIGTSDVCVTKNASNGGRHEPKTFHEVKSPATTLANNNASSVSFHGIHQHSLKTVEPFSHQYVWQHQQQQLPMQVPYDLSINSASVSSSSSSLAGQCSTTIATSCSIDSSVTTCQSNLASPVSSSVITSQMPAQISHEQVENVKSGTCSMGSSESLIEIEKVSSDEEANTVKERNGREELCNNKLEVEETSKKNVDVSSSPTSARLTAATDLNQQGKSPSLNGKLTKSADHSTTGTNSIPVGIAVARQRQEYHKSNSIFKQKSIKEHHRKQSVEQSHAQNASQNNRKEDFLREQKELVCHNDKTSTGHTIPAPNLETNLIVTGGGPTSPSCWEDGSTKAGTSIQARWMPTTTPGHGVSQQALWLGQRSYAAAPATMPMQISSLDHPSRQFPSLGYQLARDPITNLFLIPTTNIGLGADLGDRPLVWPSFTTATLATTPQQLPPHHGSFQQYILQQQQQQLLQQGQQQQQQQRTLEFRLQHESQQEITKNVSISQVVPSNIERNVGLDLSQNGNLLCPSIKEESVRCDDLKVKPTAIISTSSPTPIIASIPVPGRTFPYVFSASANPVPYYYDHTTSAAVVHVAPANTDDVNILLETDKRSQGTSPVPCPDSCLTPDSDIVCPEPSNDEGDLSDSEKMLLEQEEVDVLGDSNDSMKLEPLMADACNQTETPPMTDDEEELDDEEDDEDDDDSRCDQKRVEDGIFNRADGLIVKQEDSSIQCELLSVKSCDLSSSSSLCESFVADRKTFSAADVVNGLELLSNTIQEHEKSHGSSCSKVDEVPSPSSTFDQVDAVHSDSDTSIIPLVSSTETVTEENETVNSKDVCTERSPPKPEDTSSKEGSSEKASESTSLGGLGLLCALAEQRILQETRSGSEVENNLDTATDGDMNRNYKILKSRKEYKDFIAHKMQQYSSLGAKLANNESGGMDAAEFEMRLRLAELQQKYKEKQRELARLLPKKGKEDYDMGSSKRGPGRPRKRKLYSLYKSSKASKHRSHSDNKESSRSRREQSVFSFPSTSSKKSQEYSLLKGSLRIVGKQILKPAVLKPQKSTSDPLTWLSAATAMLAKSDLQTKALGASVPFQSGLTNMAMASPSFGKTTPIKSATMLPLSMSLSYKASPMESNEISLLKDVVATPDESSSEPSDSDDSYSCSQRKRKNKRSAMAKDLVLKHTKRKDTSKSCGRLDGKKFGRWGEDDDSVDLSVSFSSLSVSCTMPPFQGCEESTGLGLLAKYASQVVEQTESSKTGQQSHSDSEWVSDQDGATTSTSAILESRKRKPGRPKKHSPLKAEETTETIVAKKPKTLNFIKLDPTPCMTSSKLPAKNSSKSSDTNLNNSEVKYSFLEDEAWLRRRSERIFLNEPRVNPHSSFSLETTQMHKKVTTSWNVLDDTPSFSSLKSKPEQQTKSEQPKPKKKHTKVKSDSDLNPKKPKVVSKQAKEKDNSESKSEIEPFSSVFESAPSPTKTTEDAEKLPLKTVIVAITAVAAPDESDSDSPENSSFSEGDNLPLSKLIERPTTPEPRSCVIKAEELRDSLRVLTMMDGLFYAGYINAIRAPDVYGITVDGERGNRPHIYSREEVLQEAIYEVKPCSIRYLSEGTRVCAFWSQQYRCLYPGTVTRPSSPNSSPDNNSVNVEFDDGDSGRIEIDNVRLLPPDLPIISYEPDPLVVGKRRTKSAGDLSREKRPPLVPIASQSKKLSSLKSSKLTPVNNNNNNTKSASNSDESKVENGNDAWNKSFHALLPSTEIKPTSTLTIFSTPVPKSICPSWINKSKLEETTKNVIITSKPPICSSNVKKLAEVIASSTAVTTITSKTIPPASITVIAIGSGPSATSKINDTVALKSKKHKKHRDREKTDDRRHHHHHHHHHKHRRKHDKRDEDKKVVALIESMTTPAQVTITNTNTGVTTAAKVTKPGATNENDSKKSELTLTIKTNSSTTVTNRLDTDDKKNGVSGKKRTLSVDAGSSQSEDHEASSQCSSNSSDDVSSDHSDKKPLPPPSKKAKMTKDDVSTNGNGTQKNPPKAKKGKEKGSNVESKSKMAAFLPARQLWKWAGKSFKSPGKKGKAKKEFYKSITRGKETIRVGDSAVFLSTGRPHLPYIGRIEMMWESWGGNMVVKVKWFYHPEETKGGRRLADTKGALYQSLHVDENDVQTISHKCEVLSWEEYSKLKKEDGNQKSKYGASPYDNSDVYYLAGTYDPMTLVVTLEPGVS